MGIINGSYSSETINGTSAADTIYALGGNDSVSASGGNDTIYAGDGNDTVTGGAGADVFAIDVRGFDQDTITDFVIGTDRLDLRALNVADIASLEPYMSQVGSDVVIQTWWSGYYETITLTNVNLASLKASPASFIFNTSTDPLVVTGATYNEDVLFGGAGADALFGYGDNDQLNGGAGNDRLYGGEGNDTLRGGTGADRFVFNERGFENDTILDFVIGSDKLDLRGLNVSDIASLAPYMSQVGSDVVIQTWWSGYYETITLKNVNLASLMASPASFVFNTSTDPQVVGGSTYSEDVMFGGRGADVLYGYGDNDQLNGGAGNDTLDGGEGNDSHRGGAGNDVITFAGRNFGQDTVLDFTIGTDRLDLRALNVADIASLEPYMSQVGSDVVIQTWFNGYFETITLTNVNLINLKASPASFIFNTSTDPLVVIGSSYSEDVLFGGAGSDALIGYGDHDQLNGGAGNDRLYGGEGNDTLRGGAGADRFVFNERGFNNDTVLDFVIGSDKLDLRGLNVGDIATLAPYMNQVGSDVVIQTWWSGYYETITLKNVTLANLMASPASFVFNTSTDPLIVTGSTYSDDVLFGGRGADALFGAGDGDQLNGGAGNDTLNGGEGNDTLRGGAGADRFVIGVNDDRDSVLDFSSAQGDKIDLRSIDPSAAAGDQALTVVGTFTAAGQVRIDSHGGTNYSLMVNLDTNLTTAELVIDITSATAITALDLML